MSPIAAVESSPQPEWISGRQARLRLGLTPARLFKLVATHEIRVLANRGETLRYSSCDVERIVTERNSVQADRLCHNRDRTA